MRCRGLGSQGKKGCFLPRTEGRVIVCLCVLWSLFPLMQDGGQGGHSGWCQHRGCSISPASPQSNHRRLAGLTTTPHLLPSFPTRSNPARWWGENGERDSRGEARKGSGRDAKSI